MNRDKIMTDIESIQTDVDFVGYKGNNEHDLELRERIADYVVKLFAIPVVIKGKADPLICPGCGSRNIDINHNSQSFKCKDCFDGWAD